MKTNLLRLLPAVLMLSLGVSCTTAYDQYGRPRQVVEPGTAVLGAAAAGLLGYSLANNNRGHRDYRHSNYRDGRYSHSRYGNSRYSYSRYGNNRYYY